MRRWRLIIEGEAAATHFLRTLIVDAETEEDARRLARAEFEKDDGRFIEVSEVSSENIDSANVGLVEASGRIFFG